MLHILWQVVLTLLIIFAVCYVFVIAFGAPFLPTHKPQVKTALDLLELKKGQTLLELGSGDGRVLIAAAKRGYNAVGIELNPIMVLYSKLLTWRYKKQIRIIWGNIWTISLPPADGIFVFFLKPFMKKLDTKVTAEAKKPVKMVSYAFDIEGKKHARKKEGLFVYEYR